jgi:hypothetical protein
MHSYDFTDVMKGDKPTHIVSKDLKQHITKFCRPPWQGDFFIYNCVRIWVTLYI